MIPSACNRTIAADRSLLCNCHLTTMLQCFLKQVEERLAKYIDSFDIVLVGDQSMDIPNAIVRLILEGGQGSDEKN